MLLLPAALLLSACGSDGTTEAAPAPTGPIISDEGHDVKEIYYTNGDRRLHFQDGYGRTLTDIYQHCDGHDLVEQTYQNVYDRGASGNDMSRTVGHAACADGRLTPEDFALTTVEG